VLLGRRIGSTPLFLVPFCIAVSLAVGFLFATLQ
jgi:hypothetical protein